jgi:3-deoxy-manno-octulosonate cytidylyltransferase (CMP-KDO synthetase)
LATAASRELGSPRAVAVIPARLASTRLERKMLLAETGQALVVHTARNAARCAALSRVIVATDSPEIEAVVRDAGLEASMTSPAHRSGTDRVLEALEQLADDSIEVVLGLQGDEPDLAPEDLTRLVAAFADPAVQAATLCHALTEPEEVRSPERVKLVRDANGRALYFSRAPIPAVAAHGTDGADGADGAGDSDGEPAHLGHIGVYAWRPAALKRFCAMPVGALERRESLEQLRWLEGGEQMLVLDAAQRPRGIDTAADYAAFVARTRDTEHIHSHDSPTNNPDSVHEPTP